MWRMYVIEQIHMRRADASCPQCIPLFLRFLSSVNSYNFSHYTKTHTQW